MGEKLDTSGMIEVPGCTSRYTHEQIERMLVCVQGPKVINGKLFLQKLGSEEEHLTSDAVAEKLSSLTEDELQELMDSCTIDIPERPSLCFDMPESDPFEYIKFGPDSPYDGISDRQLKRMIKYEKNPMMKSKLQKELSTRNSWSGKHRKGRR